MPPLPPLPFDAPLPLDGGEPVGAGEPAGEGGFVTVEVGSVVSIGPRNAYVERRNVSPT